VITPDRWRRILRWVAGPEEGELTTITFEREGETRTWTGSRFHTDQDAGVLVELEPFGRLWVQLCTWAELRSAENGGRRVPAMKTKEV
jgi:hypothetical protein